MSQVRILSPRPDPFAVRMAVCKALLHISCKVRREGLRPEVLMIFAFVAGIMLGVEHSEWPVAAGVITGVLIVKAAVDVIWDRMPLLGLISPFVVYRYNLTQKGEPTDFAWISYSLQLIVFGLALGLATYALFHFVF